MPARTVYTSPVAFRCPWAWSYCPAKTCAPTGTVRPALRVHRQTRKPSSLQVLVRRNLLSADKYLSGIAAGTEVFKGAGRLDTSAYSVDVR
ncbi:hypothetical protein [Streptomyces finlayi]|uniref:hypothetical protein n=1 Tax=Streptomyces finlayi TaxID=67296 RepID=UPI0035BC6A16